MLKIETAYVVDIGDVCDTFGTCMDDYDFCEMAENGSYQAVSCDDGTLQELYNDLQYYLNKLGEDQLCFRIAHKINLIEGLRKLGHRGDVLVHVYW